MRIASVKTRRREAHAKRARPRFGTVHHRRIHAATGRLTQGTGRKQQAVSRTALILDCDFEIPLQAVMLQSVVAANHVAASMGFEQRARRGGAICAVPHPATPTSTTPHRST